MNSTGTLAKINTISIAGYDALNAKDLFDLSLKITLDIFESKAGAIYLLDDHGKELFLQASVGLKPEEHEHLVQHLSQLIAAQRQNFNVPIRFDASPRFIAAPFLLKGKMIGVLTIVSKSQFLDEDIELLDFIASQITLNYFRLHVNQHLKSQLGKSTEEVNVQERLASIGKLAGGIAHEFNNPLDGVMRYTNLCLQHVKEDDVVHEYLLEIRQGLKRMANIVQSLLACARNSKPSTQKIDVNKAVETALKECQPSILKKGITARAHLGANLPEITDQGLERVIGNLVRNAIDAIENGGGAIDVRTVLEHQVIKISVTDNGKGISEQDIDKIFEPFYTTKKIDAGCGLGLTIVNEIVKYANGSIEVESAPGHGTTFTVIIPI